MYVLNGRKKASTKLHELDGTQIFIIALIKYSPFSHKIDEIAQVKT